MTNLYNFVYMQLVCCTVTVVYSIQYTLGKVSQRTCRSFAVGF